VILEDFVMLGTTVPEPNSDGRVFVCSAGVSAERRGLVRIYPLARRNVPRRWHMYRVPVQLNTSDTRHESYKVAGDRRPGAHERINERFELVGEVPKSKRAALLKPFWVDSLDEANERRLSLAVVRPEALELDFDLNPRSPDSPQMALFDDGIDEIPAGAKRFPFIPRVRFRDRGEKHPQHRLMLRDWGVYERMRKQPGFETWTPGERREHIAGALHLGSGSSLLLGNFNQHRTSWLVISVLNGIRDEAQTLFDDIQEDAA
jgi:hypothetical protein